MSIEAPEETSSEVQEAEEPITLPAILVMRDTEQIRISEHNGIDPYSVPMLLRAAANIYETRLLNAVPNK